jgi:hypothetical protein
MKKLSYSIIMCIALLVAMTEHSFSQGCADIRGAGGVTYIRPIESGDSSGMLLNINNRYFKSYRHFIGTAEQHERIENGTELINDTYTMDLFPAKNINRTQSVPDKIRTDKTGGYAQGDAAFADYTVNIGVAIRF